MNTGEEVEQILHTGPDKLQKRKAAKNVLFFFSFETLRKWYDLSQS